jgi:hypothetical protein
MRHDTIPVVRRGRDALSAAESCSPSAIHPPQSLHGKTRPFREGMTGLSTVRLFQLCEQRGCTALVSCSRQSVRWCALNAMLHRRATHERAREHARSGCVRIGAPSASSTIARRHHSRTRASPSASPRASGRSARFRRSSSPSRRGAARGLSCIGRAASSSGRQSGDEPAGSSQHA